MKKLVFVFLLVAFAYSSHAQTVPFTVLNSGTFGTIPPAPGYEHSLRFNMNNGLGIKAYQIISKPDESLQFQSKAHNTWSTAMTMKSGSLGIGTTSPSAKLDVAGTAEVEKLTIAPTGNSTFLQMGPSVGLGQRTFNFSTSGNYAGFTAVSPSGTPRLTFSSDGSDYWLGLKNDSGSEIFKVAREKAYGSYIHLPQSDSRIVISQFGSYRINEGYKLVVANGDAIVEGDIIAEGNVGIGTTTPGVKLSVEGHVTIGESGNYHLKTRHIDGKDTATSAVDDLFLNYNTGKHVQIGYGGQNSNLYVSGNVGIGTSNPSEKLSVNGKILAEEVEVVVDVPPDYVFEKYYTGTSTLKDDYSMPTLAEVAAYTKAHNHLPEVPSAKEIQGNGLQLGDMTMILLQKIEELTLYTIEQEGRIKSLESKLNNKN